MGNLEPIDSCQNCGCGIGKLEPAHVWRDHIVCATCHARLATEASSVPHRTPWIFLSLIIGGVLGAGIYSGVTAFVGSNHPAAIPAAPPAAATSPTVDQQMSPSIDDFNAFAHRFAENLKRATEGDLTGSAAADGLKYKITCSVVTTDIKRADSLAHPIVGVATIRLSTFAEGPPGSDFADLNSAIYTMTFVPKNQSWQLLSAQAKEEVLPGLKDPGRIPREWEASGTAAVLRARKDTE